MATSKLTTRLIYADSESKGRVGWWTLRPERTRVVNRRPIVDDAHPAAAGPTMFGRIGVLRALHRHDVREFTDRKETHWGKRKLKLKRDE